MSTRRSREADSWVPSGRPSHERRFLWLLAFRHARGFPRNGTQSAVLYGLFQYANGVGFAHPGQERLAREIGLSVKTVRHYLERSEAEAWIARRMRKRLRQPDHYEYLLAFPASTHGWMRDCLEVVDLIERDREYVRAWVQGFEHEIDPVRDFYTNGQEEKSEWWTLYKQGQPLPPHGGSQSPVTNHITKHSPTEWDREHRG